MTRAAEPVDFGMDVFHGPKRREDGNKIKASFARGKLPPKQSKFAILYSLTFPQCRSVAR